MIIALIVVLYVLIAITHAGLYTRVEGKASAGVWTLALVWPFIDVLCSLGYFLSLIVGEY